MRSAIMPMMSGVQAMSRAWTVIQATFARPSRIAQFITAAGVALD
jgi:hypothetical protein